MNFSEEEGKTYEEAVQKALDKLNVSRERVSVEVLNENEKKGLFNFSKKVKVKVTLKDVISPEEKKANVEHLLTKILNSMNMDHQINKIHESREKIYVDLDSKDQGIIIGRWGKTIDSVQYIANLIYNKESTVKKRIVLDVGHYRKKRELMLKNLAVKNAEIVKGTEKEIILGPFSSEDRKVIHMALDSDNKVRTFSVGDGEYRTVVITKLNSTENKSL